jgi:hypothetical protein
MAQKKEITSKDLNNVTVRGVDRGLREPAQLNALKGKRSTEHVKSRPTPQYTLSE